MTFFTRLAFLKAILHRPIKEFYGGIGRSRWFIAIGLMALLPLTAFGAAGDLDTTFNGTGIVTTTVAGESIHGMDMVVQPDGKIVIVGYGLGIVVARYNSNGSLDTSFNGTGMVTTPGGSGYAVALQPDGKIVVAGDASNGNDYDFAVVRYNTDGSLDTTFNGTGGVTTPIGASNDFGFGIALQPDGKIVVVGASDASDRSRDSVVVRYNSNGGLDTTFNGTGKVIMGDGNKSARAVALQPDGKIVVVGTTIARYNPNGSLDTTFNGTGEVVLSKINAKAVALQTDGKIVVAEISNTVVRYNPDGSLDTTFNGTGEVTMRVGYPNPIGADVALQLDGKIVVVGNSVFTNTSPLTYGLSVVRYNPDGSLDTTFSNTGQVTTVVPGTQGVQGSAVALQADGKIVVAEDSSIGGIRGFTLVRYLGNPEGYKFTLNKPGSGWGRISITSSDGRVESCNSESTCQFNYPAGTTLIVRANASSGSEFTGFTGDCVTDKYGHGTVTIDGAKTCNANFKLTLPPPLGFSTVTIIKAGTGQGVVRTQDGAINCGERCQNNYKTGNSLYLIATPDALSTFAGWSGCGNSTKTSLRIMIDGNKQCVATFQSKN